jgi:excinuclease ABC subunit C
VVSASRASPYPNRILVQGIIVILLAQIYFDTPDRIPKMVLTDRVIQEKELLQSALTSLRGKRCQIKVAQRGLVKRWLDFALQNLQLAVSKHTSSQATMQARMVALAQWLHLPQGIRRMECFDISHFQGDATVASCVVFDEQGPAKRAYRRFNIQDVTANDDYAAMEQVLLRRYQKMAQDLPDLLIVDGGQGQVNIARRVLTDLGIQDHVAILGVAKGRTRKSGWETFIFAKDQPNDEILPEHSPVRHLIQFIRDEAHRFAIGTHRAGRQKILVKSQLDDIPGIGAKRKKMLLQHFGSAAGVGRANIDDLMTVSGINRLVAEKIYYFFHQK